ncbi:hypothetical protein [Enhydrobacter sp.]|jgi:hypothetical protein|uniref:hypothetical protein n=1 Tax=Enhydrobacter sp. TaxID=1894999 RepID=UPI00261BAC28|nr:hypothetical protein [Enhydrobacter sp.]WIM14505.1 MAG: hypothetical protein OJF58_005475 [Enhydrobacter sp.]
MRIPLFALGVALLVPVTSEAATAFGSFTVQVVVIGTCRIDAVRLLPQLASATVPQVCADAGNAGASPQVTLHRRGRTLLVEF